VYGASLGLNLLVDHMVILLVKLFSYLHIVKMKQLLSTINDAGRIKKNTLKGKGALAEGKR
jgi:hypothetical protein